MYRADDRLVRLQQVETMYYEDGDDDYYHDGDCSEDDDHKQDLAMC